jgi:hypothetical protein
MVTKPKIQIASFAKGGSKYIAWLLQRMGLPAKHERYDAIIDCTHKIYTIKRKHKRVTTFDISVLQLRNPLHVARSYATNEKSHIYEIIREVKYITQNTLPEHIADVELIIHARNLFNNYVINTFKPELIFRVENTEPLRIFLERIYHIDLDKNRWDQESGYIQQNMQTLTTPSQDMEFKDKYADHYVDRRERERYPKTLEEAKKIWKPETIAILENDPYFHC